MSLAANGWHIAFACEIDHAVAANDLPAVGIDRGVANTLTLSTGEHWWMPAGLAQIERRKRRAQRVLARRKRGSRRHAKARRVAALQARAARIRQDWRHKASLDVARRFATVVLEDLATRNMTRSAWKTVDAPGTHVCQKAGLNRAILAQGWHGFETVLAYKLEERSAVQGRSPPHLAELFGLRSRGQAKPRKPSVFPLLPMRLARPCRPQCCNQHPASEHGVYDRGGRAAALR
ncbi:transposase [Rhizobium mongolense]|uniref:Transposase n=1 Tax=Rhizobium mongolense TaxID=57676 RepID=A0A7W6WHH2_9HYPH|nr:transposase [Rhizobium mongolense]MBB4278316.1 transposase [Rhizobium mongolense]